MYLDANNLYGWAMSQPLPYGGFEWVNCEYLTHDGDNDRTTDNVERFIANKADCMGYTSEIDIVYPESLHDEHSDLPFLPDSIEPKEHMLSDEQKHIE